MDTREKIVSLGNLSGRVATGDWLAVVGFFDPLTAAQAARLAAVKNGSGNLLAIVLDEPDTLLTADARAALVAALRGVSLVCIAPSDEWQQALSGSQIEILEDGPADRRRSAEFVEFILQRQRQT